LVSRHALKTDSAKKAFQLITGRLFFGAKFFIRWPSQ
jgi:hypothetical protein